MIRVSLPACVLVSMLLAAADVQGQPPVRRGAPPPLESERTERDRDRLEREDERERDAPTRRPEADRPTRERRLERVTPDRDRIAPDRERPTPERELDRRPDRDPRRPETRRDDDQWFDPGWWHDGPGRDRDDDRRRDPRDGRGFDPGWWRDGPDRGDRDRWRFPPRGGWRGPGWRDPSPPPGIPRWPDHGVLGVHLRDTPRGDVVISRVVPGSPASRAGLRRGDTLLSIDGWRVTSVETAATLIQRRRPGDRLRIVFEDPWGRRRATTARLEPQSGVF